MTDPSSKGMTLAEVIAEFREDVEAGKTIHCAPWAMRMLLDAVQPHETTEEWKCLNCGWTDEPPTVCPVCSGPISPVETLERSIFTARTEESPCAKCNKPLCEHDLSTAYCPKKATALRKTRYCDYDLCPATFDPAHSNNDH